jgi:hypothetical protein
LMMSTGPLLLASPRVDSCNSPSRYLR